MPTLITNEEPCEFGWKYRRSDKKTEEYWRRNPPSNRWEEYQKKWNFKEIDYNHEPSNNGLDLINPTFAFDKKLTKYIKLGHLVPRKGKKMNDITLETLDNVVEQEPVSTLGLVEILDDNGNPTGQYRTADGVAYIADTTAEHPVTVH